MLLKIQINKYSFWKRKLFSLAGAKYDKLARKEESIFTIEEAGEALKLVANGHTNGKVIIKFQTMF